MSLTILGLLLLVSYVITTNTKEYDVSKSSVQNYSFFILLTYGFILVVGLFGCLGVGIFYWLKEGAWLDVTPSYLFSFVEDGNFLKKLVMYKSSWVGVQKISDLYADQNLAWSFLITIIFTRVLGDVVTRDQGI